MKKIFVLLALFIVGPHMCAALSRVSITPPSATLTNNGESQIFTVRLDEPIIAEVGEAEVLIHLASTDGRVSISPGTVTYGASDWWLVKTFTVTRIGDAITGGNNTITIDADTESNSEYYDGFQNSVTVHLAGESSGSGGGAAPVTSSGRAIPQTTQWWNHGEAKIPFVFTKDLIIGTTDEEVTMLQKFLNAQKFLVAITGPRSPGNETNYYGTQTKRALKNYQGLKGLRTDGIFGPLTRAAANDDLKTGRVIIN